MSISQTDFAYHSVSIAATNAQSKGKPDSGQKQGTEPKSSSRIQYILHCFTVFCPFTSFIIGTLASPYSPERYNAKAQKCGGVHKKIKANSIHGIGDAKSSGLVPRYNLLKQQPTQLEAELNRQLHQLRCFGVFCV